MLVVVRNMRRKGLQIRFEVANIGIVLQRDLQKTIQVPFLRAEDPRNHPHLLANGPFFFTLFCNRFAYLVE